MSDIKRTIIEEAGRIVSGERRAAYGPPEDNFARIARFWQAYFVNTGRDIAVAPADVSPLMRLMKEARLCETPGHYDSHVDLIGYAATGAEVNKVVAPETPAATDKPHPPAGWTKWGGGAAMPVDSKTLVFVQFVGGRVEGPHPASRFDWSHVSADTLEKFDAGRRLGNIIAYRVACSQ